VVPAWRAALTTTRVNSPRSSASVVGACRHNRSSVCGGTWGGRVSVDSAASSDSTRSSRTISSLPFSAARWARRRSVRSRASRGGSDCLRWWRWLRAVDVEWDKATPAEARDLVLWLKQAAKLRQSARTASSAMAGMINPVTCKKYLGNKHEMTTVRHSNAVVRAFYEFWIDDMCLGPLINPVRLDRGHRNRRPNAHHNPLQPYKAEGRIRYNPRIPKRQPREMPEERWRDLFAALRSNRDRAILAFAVSNGARTSELLGIRSVTWTGVTSWCGSSVKEPRPSSGFLSVRTPLSGCAFTWPSSATR
jgi:integrase